MNAAAARSRFRHLARAAILAVGLALPIAACSAPGPRDGLAAADKVEPFNRRMLDGNKRMDTYLVRPVSQAYGAATPDLVKLLLTNGLSHLSLTGDLANHILQANVDGTLKTLGRLTLNTVIGAGVLDPATEMGLPRSQTDFGLTLASYGVPEGTYLVLPLIGPTTARDAAGFAVDRMFRPTTYLGMVSGADGLAPGLTAVNIVNQRDQNFDLIDEVLYGSEDSYITLRSVYLQRRRSQVAGEGSTETLPDIFDDEEEN
ncbi:MAG: VacJ family lipoprotein [Pseudomonadota bacterium]